MLSPRQQQHGLRIEEKKSTDESAATQMSPVSHKSQSSYKSTHSSRSSVLERAREYNRRIDEQNRHKFAKQQDDYNNNGNDNRQRRAKSLERGTLRGGGQQHGRGGDPEGDNHNDASSRASSSSRRSMSAGRMGGRSSAAAPMTTRERAMASVRRETTAAAGGGSSAAAAKGRGNGSSGYKMTAAATSSSRQPQRPVQVASQTSTEPLTPASTEYTGSSGAPAATSSAPAAKREHATPGSAHNYRANATPASASRPRQTAAASASSSRKQQQQQQQQQHQYSPGNKSAKSKGAPAKYDDRQQEQPHQQQPDAVVTPELLVDALSGHEDGLLAIAERLMEHYDAGYDVMGEAIIDAFADVQKLFQHVVEAAHMEGAAFEATRREEEIAELRRRAEAAESGAIGSGDPAAGEHNLDASSPTGVPGRHDEFIDQDVKDALNDAIRKGAAYRDAGEHTQCFEIYERACQAASSLLPVDSDHRGRLQLSIARAESMSAERACAILRYSMDDVLRSGSRAVRTPLPDPSKRADVVLKKPAVHSRNNGNVQSSDEALASLMEEMKEILTAPVYNDTPLQAVSKRFWNALAESQKGQAKNAERLEQQLGKLKGDFLLAKAVRFYWIVWFDSHLHLPRFVHLDY